MYSLNRAQIVGNLTRDPEMRYTPAGQSVCSFGVATNRRWRDKDGNTQEQTEFHNVVAWGKLAELMAQLVHKGSRIYAEGRLQTRSWEGQDGGKRNRTEIVMNDFILLTPKGATPTTSAPDIVEEEIKEFPGEKEKVEPKEVGPRPTSPGLEKPAPSKPKKPASPAGGIAEEKKEKEETKEDSEEINLDDIPF
jgi:single-strand DNA-binding protein